MTLIYITYGGGRRVTNRSRGHRNYEQSTFCVYRPNFQTGRLVEISLNGLLKTFENDDDFRFFCRQLFSFATKMFHLIYHWTSVE
jgi:hypothetical protein